MSRNKIYILSIKTYFEN